MRSNVFLHDKIKWLRGQDSNLRPPGYEPDELPAAPPRVIFSFGSRERTRTSNLSVNSRMLCHWATLEHFNLCKHFLQMQCLGLLLKSRDDLLSQAVTHQVPSALKSLTSVFGMGTGVTSSLSSRHLNSILQICDLARLDYFDAIEAFYPPKL